MSKIIHTYLTVVEAQMLSTELKDVGIPCEVLDNHSNYTNRESAFIEGVRIVVPDDLYEDAVEFIQRRKGPEQSSDNQVVCPHCKSASVKMRNTPRNFILVTMSLLLGLFIPSINQQRKQYMCSNCNQPF